ARVRTGSFLKAQIPNCSFKHGDCLRTSAWQAILMATGRPTLPCSVRQTHSGTSCNRPTGRRESSVGVCQPIFRLRVIMTATAKPIWIYGAHQTEVFGSREVRAGLPLCNSD